MLSITHSMIQNRWAMQHEIESADSKQYGMHESTLFYLLHSFLNRQHSVSAPFDLTNVFITFLTFTSKSTASEL